MRQLWLVRHGETVGESSIRFHGRNDVALSDAGRAQILALVPHVRAARFTAVIASPLVRARESAELLHAGLAAPPATIAIEPDFSEIWFGELEGMTEAEIRAAMPEWHARWQRREVLGFPGGETLAGFQQRVSAGLERTLAAHPEGDLLLVVHRGVIKRIAMHLFGIAAEVGLGTLSVATIRTAMLARPK